MRAVLVANPKGGCGKTTLAINLAGALASRGDSVVLWDIGEAGQCCTASGVAGRAQHYTGYQK